MTGSISANMDVDEPHYIRLPSSRVTQIRDRLLRYDVLVGAVSAYFDTRGLLPTR